MSIDKYELKIEGLSPGTLPMERLALYLKELAALMGESQYVHFSEIKEGSALLISDVDSSVSDNVSARIANPSKAQDSRKAFENLEYLLDEDNTGASVSRNGNKIISILAKSKEKPKVYPRESCSIRGELVRIGGSDATIPFMIEEQGTGEKISGNILSKDLAIEMAQHLFKVIEVTGVGHWEHYPQKGSWKLCDFKVEFFDSLKNLPLSRSVDELLSKSNPNAKDPLTLLGDIRGENQ